MPAHVRIPIVAAHRFESPPERVYDAWLTAGIDAEYLETSRPSRLVFIWPAGGPSGERVVVDIVPTDGVRISR
jgi:uncharacterized protein YndB with AHSA1/START domain